ncbi:hypothetical protein SPD48_08185 [Pseudogracilibacillus sp. SE30717A]|uniref:hypothetical protein n=1 Tax=Pseudogracilibacillus sp. SE30717A TaxID=3098293 RepID=UPI00300DC4C4
MIKIFRKNIGIFVAFVVFLAIGLFMVFQNANPDIVENVEGIEYTHETTEMEDSVVFENGSLIGIHIGLGEVLGKATLNNGGVPLNVKEQKERLLQLKQLDLYPEEMKKVIELINQTAFQKNNK